MLLNYSNVTNRYIYIGVIVLYNMKKEEFEKRLSPRIDVGDVFEKEIKVQYSKSKNKKTGQFSIQLPIQFVDLLGIEKGDIIQIKVPYKDKKLYSIKLKKKIK